MNIHTSSKSQLAVKVLEYAINSDSKKDMRLLIRVKYLFGERGSGMISKYLLTLDTLNKDANYNGIQKMNIIDWLMVKH